MNAYLLTLLILGLAISLTVFLSPSSPRLASSVRTVSSVLMIAVLLSSLGDFAGSVSFPEIENFDAMLGESIYTGALLDGYSSGIEEDLRERCGLSDFSVSVALGEDGIPSSVSVMLRGSDLFADAVGVVDYVEQTYGLACLILYE